jgi:5-methyltetrahydrofolate--homocysteine methyltransferase
LPIVCTLSYDTNGRTMMGISPSDFSGIEKSLSPRLAACGTNCGVGASEVVACIHNLAEAMGPEVVLVAKGNCGIPQYVDGAICYNGTPEIMANYARMALDAGARIIGGCCGTSPKHLRAMRDALDAHTKQASPSLEAIISTLGDVSTGARAQWGGEQSRLGGAAPGANLARGRGGRTRRGSSEPGTDTAA